MDKTINNILLILNEVLDGGVIEVRNADEKLTKFGMDSMMFIQIIIAFEENFEIEIPDEKLLISEMDTVNKMYDVIMNAYEHRHHNRLGK